MLTCLYDVSFNSFCMTVPGAYTPAPSGELGELSGYIAGLVIRVAGELSSPGSAFCADSYFGICSTPVLLHWHVKDPGHSARKCRWQVTAKHACTLYMWLCVK